MPLCLFHLKLFLYLKEREKKDSEGRFISSMKNYNSHIVLFSSAAFD